MFDPLEGVLLIGQPAIDTHLEAGGEAVPFAEVLDAKAFPYATRHYTPIERKCSPEQAIIYGTWALSVVQENNPGKALTTSHLRRVGSLGLGVSLRRIETLFEGSINNFQQAIGSPSVRLRRLTESWTTHDCINHARAVLKYVTKREGQPRKLTATDFDQFRKDGKGPASATLFGRMRLGHINGALGYPNVREWDRDDYIEWGTRFFKMNPDLCNIQAGLMVLSRLSRGPGPRAVERYVGSLDTFRRQSFRELRRQKEVRAERLKYCEKLIADGHLDEDLRDAPEDRLLFESAKYLVHSHFVDKIQRKHRDLPLTLSDPDSFIRLIAKYGAPNITIGDVESAASILDVYDDLWPPPSDEALIVPPDLLQEMVAKLRNRPSRRRQQQNTPL